MSTMVLPGAPLFALEPMPAGARLVCHACAADLEIAAAAIAAGVFFHAPQCATLALLAEGRKPLFVAFGDRCLSITHRPAPSA